MGDRPSHNLDGLDIELARHIDAVCRKFEADWREGRQPRIEGYSPSTLMTGHLRGTRLLRVRTARPAPI